MAMAIVVSVAVAVGVSPGRKRKPVGAYPVVAVHMWEKSSHGEALKIPGCSHHSWREGAAASVMVDELDLLCMYEGMLLYV